MGNQLVDAGLLIGAIDPSFGKHMVIGEDEHA
jgi:hypothetical protein